MGIARYKKNDILQNTLRRFIFKSNPKNQCSESTVEDNIMKLFGYLVLIIVVYVQKEYFFE